MKSYHQSVYNALRKAEKEGMDQERTLNDLRRTWDVNKPKPNLLPWLKKLESLEDGCTRKNLAALIYLAHSGNALSTIDSPHFLQLMKECNTAALVSRRSMMRLLDNVTYLLTDATKKRLRNARYMSLIFDGWDAPAKQGKVIGILGQYITQDWKLGEELLGLIPTTSNHTSPFLYSLVYGCFNSWKTNELQLSAVVSDTTNSVKAAGELFNAGWWGCVCHIIQLAVHDVIKSDEEEISVLIDKVADLVTHIRGNAKLRNTLKIKQIGEPLVLVARNDTRWSSVYFMLERFIQLIGAITDILDEGDRLSDTEITKVNLCFDHGSI